MNPFNKSNLKRISLALSCSHFYWQQLPSKDFHQNHIGVKKSQTLTCWWFLWKVIFIPRAAWMYELSRPHIEIFHTEPEKNWRSRITHFTLEEFFQTEGAFLNMFMNRRGSRSNVSSGLFTVCNLNQASDRLSNSGEDITNRTKVMVRKP